MTLIHRGQLFIRGGWRDGEAVLHAVVGIVETDQDVNEHIVHGYVGQRVTDGIVLSATGYTSLPRDYEDHGGEIDTLITDTEWPRPRDTTLAGGGLMLRETRAPAIDGRKIMLAAGLFSSRGDLLSDQTMVDIAGDIRRTLVVINERCVQDWGTNGSSLSQILKQPRWGWSAEPWGFRSTMSLKSIDEAMAVERLLEDPNCDPEELAKARKTPGGWAPQVGRTGVGADARYDQFKKRMIAEHGTLAWDDIVTESQALARDAAASRIIRELMEAE